jgi:hypothetical protein
VHGYTFRSRYCEDDEDYQDGTERGTWEWDED